VKPSPTTNVRPGKTVPKTLKSARGPVVPVSRRDWDRPAARQPSSRPICLRIPLHHARETGAAPAANTGVWFPRGAIASAFGTTLSAGPVKITSFGKDGFPFHAIVSRQAAAGSALARRVWFGIGRTLRSDRSRSRRAPKARSFILAVVYHQLGRSEDARVAIAWRPPASPCLAERVNSFRIVSSCCRAAR